MSFLNKTIKWIKITELYCSIIMVAWAKNWEGNVVYAASVAVTSYFNSLNISGLISVVLYIVETVLLPMYAKFSDMIGRSEAFAIAIFFYVLSGIVQAVAPSMDALIVMTLAFFFFFFYMLTPDIN